MTPPTSLCPACVNDGVKDSKAEVCGWHYTRALQRLADAEAEIDELEQIRKLCLDAGMQEHSTTLDYLHGVFYMLKQYVEGKR